ncbi:MAG: hypothetical protein UX89_C0028G0008 [Parcubacteria group bacterium GW2011_GWA2_47_16]|nr:MAG: hypothetical protein UX89_C0028G0008 [Parcubacteria group bacterium GW2011_GWA2_47_16]
MALNNQSLSDVRIGFSIGCFWRKNEPREILKFLREQDIKTVELKKITSSDQVGDPLSSYLKEEFGGFSFTSYHAPKFAYGKNEETKRFLREMEQLHELHPLNLLVVHPDIVEDFSVFNDLPFPVGFENMDTQKKSHRTVADMQKLLSQNPKWRMVLDLNHCFVNDPSMRLAHDFYDALGDRISEIHLSGFKKLHDPLFETKQEIIIRSLRDMDAPIVIESEMNLDQAMREREYILGVLKN